MTSRKYQTVSWCVSIRERRKLAAKLQSSFNLWFTLSWSPAWCLLTHTSQEYPRQKAKLWWSSGAFLWRRGRFSILSWSFYLKVKLKAAGVKTNLKAPPLWLKKLSADRNMSLTGYHSNRGMMVWPDTGWPITGIICRCKKKIIRPRSACCFSAANEAAHWFSSSEEPSEREREKTGSLPTLQALQT